MREIGSGVGTEVGSEVQVAVAPPATDVPTLALPRGTRHIPSLDGLRGLAILAVLGVHSGVNNFGGCGVDIFFVLSGYLITGILLNERIDTGRVGFKNFYARRWLRLFPALMLLVVLYIPASKLMHLHVNDAVKDSFIALFYMSNWTRAFGSVHPDFLGHTWSLSVEEQFYLIWPPVVLLLYKLFGRTWKAAGVCLAGMTTVILYRWWMIKHGASMDRFANGLDTRMDTLMAGAAIAFFTPKLSRFLSGALAWIAVAAFAVYFSGWYHESFEYVLGWTVVLLLGLLNARAGLLSRLLSLRPLVWIGKISYGLYLFHFPIMKWMIDHNWTVRDKAVVGSAMGFGLATLSYYLVERPCLRLKDRFRGPEARPREAQAPAAGNEWIACEMAKGTA
jgi:peptidoglycan/LPS O-acetylase OafA/YrhL